MKKYKCPSNLCNHGNSVKVIDQRQIDPSTYKQTRKKQQSLPARVKEGTGRKYRQFKKIKAAPVFSVELMCSNPKCGFAMQVKGKSRSNTIGRIPSQLRQLENRINK